MKTITTILSLCTITLTSCAMPIGDDNVGVVEQAVSSFTYTNVNSNDGAPLTGRSAKENALRCIVMEFSRYHYNCRADVCLSRTGNNSNPRKMEAKNCVDSHTEYFDSVGTVLVRRCDLVRDGVDKGDLYYRPNFAATFHEAFYSNGAYALCKPNAPSLKVTL